MTSVVVLGATGMLGSMTLDVLARDPNLKVIATARDETSARSVADLIPEVDWQIFDALTQDVDTISQVLVDAEWVINAIGLIKPYIAHGHIHDSERAIFLNSVFPHRLARAAEATGSSVLQIATDCVFSGRGGPYNESSIQDPDDVYGKSKSLGEVFGQRVHHLRCSIIGPEPKAHVSLLDWFLNQPKGATVKGFTNHLWNGITTLHFAKLCQAVISGTAELPHLQHIVPGEAISKADLLGNFQDHFGRGDIEIEPVQADQPSNRTLGTDNESLNAALWQAAKYTNPPSMSQMIEELASFDFRIK